VKTATIREHEVEPVPGLPGKLPEGEGILWQGSPRPLSFALRSMRLKGLLVYFALLVGWALADAVASGATPAEVARAPAIIVLLGWACLGVLFVIGRAMAKASIYTVTNKRLVFRVGLALPMTINIPFSAVQSAAVRRHKDGTEDIVLTMLPGHKASWVALWPHARPWRFNPAEPMLRGVPVTEGAAAVIARALAESVAQAPARAVDEVPIGAPDIRGVPAGAAVA
jgi:hypothetical protein